MRYLCMGYHAEQALAAMSDREREAMLQETAAFEASLRKNGHYVDGKALQRSTTAATLRFDSGQVSITDGPFAETKEQLGGVLVLEARDLNHAIQLMSQVPCMRLGGAMEIRPINEEISRACQYKTDGKYAPFGS